MQHKIVCYLWVCAGVRWNITPQNNCCYSLVVVLIVCCIILDTHKHWILFNDRIWWNYICISCERYSIWGIYWSSFYNSNISSPWRLLLLNLRVKFFGHVTLTPRANKNIRAQKYLFCIIDILLMQIPDKLQIVWDPIYAHLHHKPWRHCLTISYKQCQL